jgi:hypothetical protein
MIAGIKRAIRLLYCCDLWFSFLDAIQEMQNVAYCPPMMNARHNMLQAIRGIARIAVPQLDNFERLLILLIVSKVGSYPDLSTNAAFARCNVL